MPEPAPVTAQQLGLAGDRDGVDFYAHDRICAALELTLDDDLVVRADR